MVLVKNETTKEQVNGYSQSMVALVSPVSFSVLSFSAAEANCAHCCLVLLGSVHVPFRRRLAQDGKVN